MAPRFSTDTCPLALYLRRPRGCVRASQRRPSIMGLRAQVREARQAEQAALRALQALQAHLKVAG